MSQGLVQSEIKTFIRNYNEEIGRENTTFPLRDLFDQIKGELEFIQDIIASDPDYLRLETDWMRETMNYLNKLLNKCQRVSEKHRSNKKICLSSCSSLAELLLVVKSKEKLQVIIRRIKEVLFLVDYNLLLRSNISYRKNTERTFGDVDEPHIFGWEQEAEEIIMKSLIKENNEGLNVVGIVGMFGTGKTALARKIFVSEQVIDHFQLRLWVWVSENCDEERLLRRVLYNLGIEDDHIDEMLNIDRNLGRIGVLLFLIHMELSSRRYLIVFDDVVHIKEHWHSELDMGPPQDKKQEWSGRLAYGLPKGGGSAIIITSRKEHEILKMVGTGDIYTPQPLLGEDGWALFKISFEQAFKMPVSYTKLDNLRKQVTNKCHGLPIALKVAGKEMAAAYHEQESPAILDKGRQALAILEEWPEPPPVTEEGHAAQAVAKEAPVLVEGREAPAVLEEGLEVPALLDKGREAPAVIEEGLEVPALLDEGREAPAVIEEGLEVPALLDKGREVPAVIEEGLEAPAPLDEGSEAPAILEEGLEVPALLDKGREAPAVIEEGLEVPALLDEGREAPAVIEEGLEVPALLDKGREAPAVTEEGLEVPALLDEGREAPAVIEEGLAEPAKPQEAPAV
ncbi:hypothetical protein AAC387_Pa06g3163 [Persea americana]